MVPQPLSYRRNTTVKTELINFRLPDDLAAALKRAASDELRSINGQGVYYLRKGLLEAGRYLPGNADVAPAGQVADPPSPAVPAAVPTPSAAEPAPTPRRSIQRTPAVQLPEIARPPTHADRILDIIRAKLETNGIDRPDGQRAVLLLVVKDAVGLDTETFRRARDRLCRSGRAMHDGKQIWPIATDPEAPIAPAAVAKPPGKTSGTPEVADRPSPRNRMPMIADEDMDAYLAASSPLAFWRKHRNLTQTQLAKAAGISQPYVAQLEAGAKHGTAAVYARLAGCLGVRADDLIETPR
jgi:DNA-binding XRE family transcriptional regulator